MALTSGIRERTRPCTSIGPAGAWPLIQWTRSAVNSDRSSAEEGPTMTRRVNGLKMRNIGPKSAAWLRQVGLRTPEDIAAVGSVEAFMRVKRAGFKPSLNLLYALEGALRDCHW